MHYLFACGLLLFIPGVSSAHSLVALVLRENLIHSRHSAAERVCQSNGKDKSYMAIQMSLHCKERKAHNDKDCCCSCYFQSIVTTVVIHATIVSQSIGLFAFYSSDSRLVAQCFVFLDGATNFLHRPISLLVSVLCWRRVVHQSVVKSCPKT